MPKKKAAAAKMTKAQATEVLIGELADILAEHNGLLWKIRDAERIALIAKAVASNISLVTALMR